MHIDGAQARFNYVSLRDCVRIAFDVKFYQIEGPAWIASEHFNISARLPEGAPQNMVREMLRNLLADRFRMKFHREKKDFPVYALTLGKEPLKLSETADEDATANAESARPAMDLKATSSTSGVFANLGNGSYFTFADERLAGHKLPMWRIADILANFLDRPVVDMTGLDRDTNYDFSFKVTPEDYLIMQARGAAKSAVSLPPEFARLAEQQTESLEAAVAAAGLKLEARKAPLEAIVIDSADRKPAEN
jgi:uncharacterized protein (TIGR03435 family)